MAGDATTNQLIAQARCYDCYAASTLSEVQTYVLASVAGVSTNPNELAQLAKCMTCYSPDTLIRMKLSLVAHIGQIPANSKTLLQGSACYECIPPGFLQPIETYQIVHTASSPSTDIKTLVGLSQCLRCLSPMTLLEVQVYLLSLISGVAITPDSVPDIIGDLDTIPTGIVRRLVTRTVVIVVEGGGLGGCTDVPASLVPVITPHYVAGALNNIDILFPKVCCHAKGYWIYGASGNTQLQQGLISASAAGKTLQVLGVDVTGIADSVGIYVKQECADGSLSGASNTVMFTDISDVKSYWNFDDVSIGVAYTTAADAKNGNNLTSELASHPLAAAGLIGSAPSFVSVNNDRLSHASNSDFDVSPGDSITFSLWFRLDNPSTNSGIISKWNAADFSYLLWINTSNVLVWQVKNAVGTVITLTLGTPTTSNWHHIVAGYDNGANQIYAYFDNGARSNQACVGIKSTVYKVAFGNYNDSQPVSGRIDLAGVWKRVLSAAEVSFLFNGGAGRNYPF